jgi:chitin disaccharide deacetylase
VKYLIVNADDFGQSAGVNRGVIQAHEHGILTSASLMVRWPHAVEAAAYAQMHPSLGVGIHLDFGEWTCKNGEWKRLYSVVDTEDHEGVKREITSQMAAFCDLMGREPTHIDSHQHVHRNEPARSMVVEVAGRLGIPARDVPLPPSSEPRARYCGRFYGQGDDGTQWPECISVEALIEILGGLEPGFTELGCHPATEPDLETMYKVERLQELATLCHPRVREAVETMGIELCSFMRLGLNLEKP